MRLDVPMIVLLLQAGTDPRRPRRRSSDRAGPAPIAHPENAQARCGQAAAGRIEGTEGDTPLLMAVYRAQPEAVHLLLTASANAREPKVALRCGLQ